MPKNLFIFLILIILFGCGGGGKIWIQDVEFPTEDNLILKGTLYAPQAQKKLPAVALAHMKGKNRKSWDSFARKLAENGYVALTFDFRGRGETGGTENILKSPADVIAGVNYLGNFGLVDRANITVIGADMGGTAGIIAGTQNSLIKQVITISSPPSQDGLESLIYIDRLSPKKVVIITAKEDSILAETEAYKLYLSAKEPREWRSLNTNAHGSDIFGTAEGKELENILLTLLR
jgi:dienelactone hydrolase